MAEHENLQLHRSVAAAEEHDELEQATDDDVQSRHTQGRPPAESAKAAQEQFGADHAFTDDASLAEHSDVDLVVVTVNYAAPSLEQHGIALRRVAEIDLTPPPAQSNEVRFEPSSPAEAACCMARS